MQEHLWRRWQGSRVHGRRAQGGCLWLGLGPGEEESEEAGVGARAEGDDLSCCCCGGLGLGEEELEGVSIIVRTYVPVGGGGPPEGVDVSFFSFVCERVGGKIWGRIDMDMLLCI